jgi:CHAT domain-containing protein
MLIPNDNSAIQGRTAAMAFKSRFVAAALALLVGATATLAADAPQSAAPLPRTVADITRMLAEYKVDPKKSAEQLAILATKPPQTDSKKDLAMHHLKLATAAGEIGALQRQAEHMRAVIDLGGAEDKVAEYGALLQLEYRIGNLQRGLATSQRFADEFGKRISAHVFKAVFHAALGDFEQANESLSLVEKIYKDLQSSSSWAMWNKLFVVSLESTRNRVFSAQGKEAEAESAMRAAIQAALDDEEINKLRLARRISNFPQGLREYQADFYRSLLAGNLINLGRLTEAEQAAREAFGRSAARTGAGSIESVRLLPALAQVLAAQGRTQEAAALVAATLGNLEQQNIAPDSVAITDLRRIRGDLMVAEGRYAEALQEYQKIRDAFAAYPEAIEKLAGGDIGWAIALLKAGKADEASTMLDKLIVKTRQWLGDKHIDTAELVGAKGMSLVSRGDRKGALDAFRSALPVLLNAAISAGDEPSPLRAQRLSLILDAYLALLAEIRGTPVETAAGLDAASEGFRIADALRGQKIQGAVAASALRSAANDPAIGAEIRKEQDLAQESSALQRILRDLMNAPAEKQLSRTIGNMQARIETIKQERTTIQAGIEKRFPAYANLIRPQPPSLAEARAVLRPGEALINIFATDGATYLWAFKKDGPVAFASTKVNRDELTRRVQGLRKALDPVDADLAKGIPEFDLDAAHRLYTDLLLPIAPGWQGAATLLVAANGALSQLPLALLPTQKVAVKADPKLPYGHFKDVPWLIRQAAFTQLPSVNALVALRKLPAASAERAPFVGFGDPQFSETPIQIASSRGRLRNLSIARPSLRDLEQGKSVEWLDYGKIPPLPDTRDEILALAQALKANPEADVFLGSKASKENLKKLDLAKRKVVAFATHGLLAGDFPGVSEPSLALANPGGGKHGLLTLEDILGLKLDADWVVLSACNTAGGDGEGADALSGLGRGFFYAGSRALLVTHWPVESGSAKTLVTGIFERQAADPKLSRAEALRQSMLALLQARSPDNAFSYAHPLFWAPYALVGEGGI